MNIFYYNQFSLNNHLNTHQSLKWYFKYFISVKIGILNQNNRNKNQCHLNNLYAFNLMLLKLIQFEVYNGTIFIYEVPSHKLNWHLFISSGYRGLQSSLHYLNMGDQMSNNKDLKYLTLSLLSASFLRKKMKIHPIWQMRFCMAILIRKFFN